MTLRQQIARAFAIGGLFNFAELRLRGLVLGTLLKGEIMQSKIYCGRLLAVAIVALALAIPLYLAGCGGDGGNVSLAEAVPPIHCESIAINNADGTQTVTQNCVDGNGNRIDSPGDNSAVGDTTTDTNSGDTNTTTTTTNPAGAG